MAKDPVCGMAVDDKAVLRSTYAGQTYVFCSASCKSKFDKKPDQYATPGGQVQGGRRA